MPAPFLLRDEEKNKMSGRAEIISAINKSKAPKTTLAYKDVNSIDVFGENVFSTETGSRWV